MGIRTDVVTSGDTLTKIAKRNNVSLDELIRINTEISNPNLIFVGQEIKIPTEDVELSPQEEAINVELQQNEAAPVEETPVAINQSVEEVVLEPTPQPEPAPVEAAPVAPIQEEVPQPEIIEAAPEPQPEPAPQPEVIPEQPAYNGPRLTSRIGRMQGPSGEETYYNLDMSGCFGNVAQADLLKASMDNLGLEYPRDYHIREDGAKCLGDYVLVAAELNLHPKGSIVETSLGKGIVVDTGEFALSNPTQIDIATNW